MIYFEAVANALDANANEINISISAKALNKPESLEIEISDNGLGFTDERYRKFSKLFDVDENSHKGLGRLVYLCYFRDVQITSYFDGTKKREFDFNEDFDDKNCKISYEETPSGSIFKMKGCSLQKIAKNEYLKPEYLKNRILEDFYSRLFQLKKMGQEVTINVKLNIENIESNAVLKNPDIPDFTTVELDSSINLIDKFSLHYSIQEVDITERSLIAAISVDNRTVKVDIVAEENIPSGYKMVFLLFSDYFTGKVDATRQNLTISKTELKEVQNIFRKKVASLIEEKIPKVKIRNQETKNSLTNKYPHLGGYFDTENIGYVARTEILKRAQDEFFKAQKELLEATSLTEEQFEKSMEISARALTEYILFRQLTIDKLKTTTKEETEEELHQLFAIRRKEGKFEKKNAVNDIYKNNSWLLDDKYMTYETVLSERTMEELVNIITDGEAEKDDNRPDIALVFSNNPAENRPFDVVIVELKRRGITLEENMKVTTQLEKRARKLMKYFNNQIQRIWFYGIIEFNEDIEMHLAGDYQKLYSSGKMFYKETKVVYQLAPELKLPVGIFIWDLDAVVGDANARNSAFLNLIKSKFINK